MAFTFFAIGILAAVGFLVLRGANGGKLPLLLKILATASFVCFASLNGFNLFCVGLIFCLLGDVFLDLKITYPNDDKFYTVAGISSFLVAQVFFITYLANSTKTVWYIFLIAPAVAAAIIAFCVYVLKLKFGRLLPLISLYTLALVLTVCQAATSLAFSPNSTPLLLALLGSLFFLASDGILSMVYFGEKNLKPFILTNHLTYYIAIALYAFSVAVASGVI